VYTGETRREKGIDGGSARIVYQVTVRTSLANGQMLIVPKVDVATWWSLIKRLIYIACRVVSHARRTSLLFERSNLWKEVFTEVHAVFA
jgi:hypothetical protein